jgi:hypothetical protein
MGKGFVVSTFLIIIVIVFLLMFIVGIAGNWKPVAGDIFGVISFFTAVKATFGEFISVTSLITWTMIFFAVEGLFLFAYYKIARFIWVRIPEMQAWFENTKKWFNRY